MTLKASHLDQLRLCRFTVLLLFFLWSLEGIFFSMRLMVEIHTVLLQDALENDGLQTLKGGKTPFSKFKSASGWMVWSERLIVFLLWSPKPCRRSLLKTAPSEERTPDHFITLRMRHGILSTHHSGGPSCWTPVRQSGAEGPVVKPAAIPDPAKVVYF